VKRVLNSMVPNWRSSHPQITQITQIWKKEIRPGILLKKSV